MSITIEIPESYLKTLGEAKIQYALERELERLMQDAEDEADLIEISSYIHEPRMSLDEVLAELQKED